MSAVQSAHHPVPGTFEKSSGGVLCIVRVHREIKGRGGKPVSIIRGLNLGPSELKRLCQQIKKHCGVGGSISGAELVIQGDQRTKIVSLLEQQGIAAKLGGG